MSHKASCSKRVCSVRRPWHPCRARRPPPGRGRAPAPLAARRYGSPAHTLNDQPYSVSDLQTSSTRKRDPRPILFDFDTSARRKLTETVSLLARMVPFVVADLTYPRSIPQELGAIIPHQPSAPVQLLLQDGAALYAMFETWRPFP